MSNRIDPSLTQFQTKKFILRSILFVSAIWILSFVVLSYFQNQLKTTQIAGILESESEELSHYYLDVQESIQNLLSDAFVTSRVPSLRTFGDALDPEIKREVNSYLSNLITRVEIYDNIRVLDLHGNELIRVELVNRRANVVPDKKLNPTDNCSGFEELRAIPDDGYFLSNYQLATKKCVIQLPPKPILSAGVPLFNTSGIRYGYLLFDLLTVQEFGYPLNNKADDFHHNSHKLIIVNPDGYYLVNDLDPYSTFGFMLAENASRNFATDFPDEWQTISDPAASSGQVQTEHGTFTFQTIDLASGIFIPAYHQRLKISTAQPYYKLVGVSTAENLALETAPITDTTFDLTILATIGSLLIGVSAAAALGVISMNRRTLLEQALHDSLTGLPNRKFFMQQLENALMLNRRRSDTTTVIFIDLDGFKGINDSYGHKAGDHMLQHVSDSIFKSLRKTDFLARLGGDEFVAISYDINTIPDAELIAGRILEAVAQPADYQGISMSLTASIGVALNTGGVQQNIDVLSVADNAMYTAKNRGKNCFTIQQC